MFVCIVVCYLSAPDSCSILSGDDRVDQVRFVLKQKLNKDTVEANIVHGCEDETNSIVFNILPAFPNVVSCH